MEDYRGEILEEISLPAHETFGEVVDQISRFPVDLSLPCSVLGVEFPLQKPKASFGGRGSVRSMRIPDARILVHGYRETGRIVRLHGYLHNVFCYWLFCCLLLNYN